MNNNSDTLAQAVIQLTTAVDVLCDRMKNMQTFFVALEKRVNHLEKEQNDREAAEEVFISEYTKN